MEHQIETGIVSVLKCLGSPKDRSPVWGYLQEGLQYIGIYSLKPQKGFSFCIEISYMEEQQVSQVAKLGS